MPIDFIRSTWVDVPDEETPPVGAPATEAAEFNRIEDALEDLVEHANSEFEAHDGIVPYVGDSTDPPTNPPNGLFWVQPNTGDVKKNTGTPGSPVWDDAFSDPGAMRAGDFITDFVYSGYLPSVPSNTLTLVVPTGVAYVGGERIVNNATNVIIAQGRAKFVDLKADTTYATVDYAQILDNGDDAFNESLSSNVTSTTTTGSVSATASRITFGASATAGAMATERIDTKDISGYGVIYARVRSSVDAAEGDFVIHLDNTADCASPVHSLDVPALSANAWTEIEIPYTPGAGSDAIISIGVEMDVDLGAVNFDFEELWAIKASEPAVTAGAQRLALVWATDDVKQRQLITVSAVNSHTYHIFINGVDVTYTADGSATTTEVRDGLIAAINDSVDPLVEVVTATSVSSTTFYIEANTAGTAFTISVGTNLTNSTLAANSAGKIIQVDDHRDLTTSFPAITLASLGALASNNGTSTGYEISTPSAIQSLSAGDAITANAYHKLIQPAASAHVTMTSAPTIGSGTSGQRIRLINVDTTYNVILQDQGTLASSNLRLQATTITLTPRDSVELLFLDEIGDWIQVGPVSAVL